MLPGISRDDAIAVLYAHNPKGYLDELRSTPEGTAVFEAIVDMAVRIDAQNADQASALRVLPASHQVAAPASGAEYATTTLAVTMRRPLKQPITIPAGSRGQSPDGHVFVLDGPLSWGVAEVGVTKTVTATALVAGYPGFLPPGSITEWTPIAKGITGVGTQIAISPGIGQPRHLRFTTDTAQPHPFKATLTGLYVVVESGDLACAPNFGRMMQIARVNDADPWSSAVTPEGRYARSAEVDTTVDASLSAWTLGSFGFQWRALDWSDLGLTVTNTTEVVGGRLAVLDEIAIARGRPREAGEGDEGVRRRLTLAPQRPSPIGLLRKCILSIGPYGFFRLDLRIYEMGEPAPASVTVDPYAPNFPAAMGFIADLHCCSMTTPETPDGVASRDPDYVALSPFFNPGLALVEGPRPWTAIVRWDPPSGMGGPQVAAIRKTLFAAARQARQPGCLVQLYFPQQWSFP